MPYAHDNRVVAKTGRLGGYTQVQIHSIARVGHSLKSGLSLAAAVPEAISKNIHSGHSAGVADAVEAIQALRGVTKESNTARLRLILAKPDALITSDDLKQLAALEGAHPSVRPAFPDTGNVSASHMHFNNLLPTKHLHAAAAFSELRDMALMDPAGGAARIQKRILEGDAITPRIARFIHMEKLVERGMVEVPPQRLLSAVTNTSPALQDISVEEMYAALEATGHFLKAVPTPTPDSQRIATQLSQLIDDNLERISGGINDGYPNFPEYSDFGKIRALVHLLENSLSTSSSQLNW